MPPPIPTPIYHITPIANLRRIAGSGCLFSKNELIRRGLSAANISFDRIQRRRSQRIVNVAPGGTLHDYVPCHFAPRSPMLDTINRGNVPNCDYRQQDIVHLVARAQSVQTAGHSFVFSDFHAVLEMAKFHNNLANLGVIAWDLFFEPPLVGGYCKYYFSKETNARYATRCESREAEFLVHNAMPIELVERVAVIDQTARDRVTEALAGTGWNPNVEVVRGWYF